jgi:hypothetical protein
VGRWARQPKNHLRLDRDALVEGITSLADLRTCLLLDRLRPRAQCLLVLRRTARDERALPRTLIARNEPFGAGRPNTSMLITGPPGA